MLAAGGFVGNWWISNRLAEWPSWMLMPGAMLSIVCLVLMVIGLGLATIRALYPVLALMELDWDAEPLAALGIPLPLQRKCERLGFWAAEDITRAIERGSFPWTELEYDERMQLERAAQRWSRAAAADKALRKARRQRIWKRPVRGDTGE